METYITSREIAKACNVRPVTVRQWRSRHGDFPVPEATYGGTAIYDPAKVEAWLERHHKQHDPFVATKAA